MKRSILFIVTVLISEAASSQHSSNSYNRLADSLYAKHHFLEASRYYEKALKNAPDPGSIMVKLARSFGKLNETNKSEYWFFTARSRGAELSNDDIYQYAQVLSMHEKREMAETVLQDLIRNDPYARKEREFLEDLLNYKKYYRDSANYKVRSLPVNTTVSEFAPAFYKDGIVYSSATAESRVKQKYHWDNSHFLNLLYSKLENGEFQKPSFFERHLNTKYHDGPAVFYNDFNSMIVNRNERGNPSKTNGREVWHMELLDGQYSSETDAWEVNSLPFEEAPYSFLHPSISEDGQTLYFVSDKPDGYGGTDIYKTVRLNGTWSEPFNLGPSVNSSENEVFPFYTDDALYFASRGHGGLGGLDIYKSAVTINGFAPPENLRYPINSPKDDFSFIISKDQRTGYFASSRTGNDDLYSFKKNLTSIRSLAHTFDGLTRDPLNGASVQIISASANDISLLADSCGNFSFSLPENTDYIMIATKEDKVGMQMVHVSAASEQAIIHQVPAYSDTTSIPCIGIVNDEKGVAMKAKTLNVVDENTKKEILQLKNSDIISFAGEKNHTYRVEIKNVNGDTTIHRIHIEPGSNAPKMWTMTIKDAAKSLIMAARIFNADNDEPLANAKVEIITFAESNFELSTDAAGRVDFVLPEGTTYLLVGSTSKYTGMLSGVAEKGLDKASITHPVPAFGDKESVDTKIILALITDENGNIIKDPTITVKNKISGESVSVKISDGLLYFKGKKDSTYTVTVDHEDFNSYKDEITVTEETNNVEKISIVVKRASKEDMLRLTLRVFEHSNNRNVAGATVVVISAFEQDYELLTDSTGIAEYSLTPGIAYMAIARKDSLIGNFIGTSEEKFSKQFLTNLLPMFDEAVDKTPLVVKITDGDGQLVPTAKTAIHKTASGEKISIQENGGLVGFMGKYGEEYTVTVSDENFQTLSRQITVGDADENGIIQMSIPLKKSSTEKNAVALAVQVVKASDKQPLSKAKVVVISFIQQDMEFTTGEDGRTSFEITEENDYMIIGSKDGYVGMLIGNAEQWRNQKEPIHLIETVNENKNTRPIVSQIIDSNGNKVDNAKILVTETSNQKAIDSKFKNGILIFFGVKGKKYNILVESKGQTSTYVHAVSDTLGAVETTSIIIPSVYDQQDEVHPKSIVSSTSYRNLILFATDQGTSKVYFFDHDSLSEVIESNGKLILQNGNSSEVLGDGDLSSITTNNQILSRLKLTESSIITLKNIYFDFNKAQLDADDKSQLENVKNVLVKFPELQLTVSAHADDRGNEDYNLSLSRRRAKAVGSFLIKGGIGKNRVVQKAMGETAPDVPCLTRECSEAEHQRNRRAEFVLRSTTLGAGLNTASKSVEKSNANIQITGSTNLTYSDILDQYGNSRIENLKIKIALGVYRFNTTLTFNELKDLGKIEAIQENGITYYYLSEINTLNQAEAIRKKVIERGTKDAYILFYYNDQKVAVSDIVSEFK
jgi:outer membrane protein OmpA-like peptidoglycan-associated protein